MNDFHFVARNENIVVIDGHIVWINHIQTLIDACEGETVDVNEFEKGIGDLYEIMRILKSVPNDKVQRTYVDVPENEMRMWKEWDR